MSTQISFLLLIWIVVFFSLPGTEGAGARKGLRRNGDDAKARSRRLKKKSSKKSGKKNSATTIAPSASPTSCPFDADLPWVQVGDDIYGESEDDKSGYSVSMSADGKTVAIGAQEAGNFAGQVRIFQWDGANLEWSQVGSDIDGSVSADRTGDSVSLSADGTTVAIGALNNVGGNGADGGGYVRVYQWDGSSWVQLGDVVPLDEIGSRFADSVVLSADGTIVAVGGRRLHNNALVEGLVHVHQWNEVTGEWTELGTAIASEENNDWYGLEYFHVC